MEDPGDWTVVAPAGDLPDGRLVAAMLGDQELLLYRRADQIFALSNRCTHQGAPLHRGRVSGAGSTLSVTCPLHGSMFRLESGRVLRGPATRPVPAYDARLIGTSIEVRPRR